jgi:hypothetical protein
VPADVVYAVATAIDKGARCAQLAALDWVNYLGSLWWDDDGEPRPPKTRASPSRHPARPALPNPGRSRHVRSESPGSCAPNWAGPQTRPRCAATSASSGWPAHPRKLRARCLRRRIKLGVLAALDQRIGLRYNMPSTTSEETASYLRHHLALAGRSDTLFSDDATNLIRQTSRGYPPAASTTSVRHITPPSSTAGRNSEGGSWIQWPTWTRKTKGRDDSMPAKQRSR